MHRSTSLAILCGLILGACGDDGPGDNASDGGGGDGANGPICGDGVHEGLEECDDGDDNSDTLPDACRTTCTLPACGDGVVDTDELCDDGVANSDIVPGACRADCAPPRCGDGVVDVTLNELCDCGDDPADLAQGCEHPNGDPAGVCGASCQVHMCGNGVLDPGELCDDGNLASGDGCAANCLSDETCGNQVVDAARGEECDDGNALTHDGCDSRCADESRAWRFWPALEAGRSGHTMAYHAGLGRLYLHGGELQEALWRHDAGAWAFEESPEFPYIRARSGMVYDASRDRLVIFGGVNAASVLADTWEFDGVTWARVVTANQPPAREGHAMAYDAARQRVVIFGGYDWAGPLSDTWEYDGTDWTEVTAATSPPARVHGAMAHDAVRNRTVLYGGCTDIHYLTGCVGSRLADTWEFDGTTWTSMTLTSAPGARSGHALAFDAGRGVVVLIGGRSPTAHHGDLWSWNGSAWQAIATVGAPAPRGGHAVAYDSDRDVLVLYGGCAAYGDGFVPCLYPYQETWELDGATWAETTRPTLPAPRLFHATVSDSARGLLVMHGGSDGTDEHADTWEFDGTRWTEAAAGPALAGHALAYDPLRERVVLFGGCGSLNFTLLNLCADIRDATWEFDGAGWTQRTTASAPTARYWHAMTFDEARQTVLLHGGNQNLTTFNDTWEFDGTDWAQIPTANPPPPRVLATLTYDAARMVAVLAGGRASSLLFETWEFDGTDWTQRALPTTPAPRIGHAVAFDATRGTSVLFAGCVELGGAWNVDCPVSLDDTWEYDGVDWAPIATSTWPGVRLGHSATHHPIQRGVFLFGGADTLAEVFQDTWRYRSESAFPTEHCFNAVDDDGDGLADCADPDCDGRPCRTGTCQAGACQ